MKTNAIESTFIEILIKEKRRDRFWRNIRFFVIVVPLFALFAWQAYSVRTGQQPDWSLFGPNGDYAAMVRIDGTIASGTDNSAERIGDALEKAFEKKDAKGVILLINSPGGSASQSILLHDKILALKKAHPDVRLVAVAEDFVASGAYMAASAADSIAINDATIVGSIGAVMRGFGFPAVMEEIGVERRVFASGPHKNRLDPFQPLTDDDRSKAEELVGKVNAAFSERVQGDRGGKLKGEQTELFSGDFWVGKDAVERGLADRIAPLDDVLEDLDATEIVDLSPGRLYRSLKGVLGSLVLDLDVAAAPRL